MLENWTGSKNIHQLRHHETVFYQEESRLAWYLMGAFCQSLDVVKFRFEFTPDCFLTQAGTQQGGHRWVDHCNVREFGNELIFNGFFVRTEGADLALLDFELESYALSVFAENYEVFKSCPSVVCERNIVEVTKPQFTYEFLETMVDDQTEGKCGKRVALFETFS